MKFHSPYQFIAIKPAPEESKTDYENREALKNNRNNYVRHDRWHKEGLSGRIRCTLTTESPLVVGAEQTAGTKKAPGCVSPYQHPDGTLAIPANSLRGMISNIAETLSNSSLRVLTSQDDCTYSVRKEADEDVFEDLGLLYKKGNELYIYPFETSYSVGNYEDESDNDTIFLTANQAKTFQNRAENRSFVYAKITDKHFASQLSYEPEAGKEKGILYIRGKHLYTKKNGKYIPSKKSEHFILWDGEIDESQGIKVTQKVKELASILRLIHNKNEADQQHPKGYRRDFKNKKSKIVEEGDLLYYKKNEKNDITELSYSQIWRRPVKGTLYDAVRHAAGEDALPWNKERNRLTPAEALFGVVEEDFSEKEGARNLASRLQFTDATPIEDIKLGECITLKILDSPKPPSPAMYFNSGGKSHLAKRELDLSTHNPNGRKHYLPQPKAIEKNSWETEIPRDQKDKNWTQHLNCRPICTGTTFSFYIHFENLSREELGLLQTAISPTKKNDIKFIHRLGLGKPLGLGQITLKLNKIEMIDRVKRYSLEGLKKEHYRNLDKPQVDMTFIDQESHDALLTLYNPDNIKHPVCYPFMGEKAYTEDKGYEWFVENKKQQGLTPIAAENEIPVLNSYSKKRN